MENNKKANLSDLKKEVNDDYSKNKSLLIVGGTNGKTTVTELPKGTIVEYIQNQINSRLIDTKCYEKPKSKYHK